MEPKKEIIGGEWLILHEVGGGEYYVVPGTWHAPIQAGESVTADSFSSVVREKNTGEATPGGYRVALDTWQNFVDDVVEATGEDVNPDEVERIECRLMYGARWNYGGGSVTHWYIGDSEEEAAKQLRDNTDVPLPDPLGDLEEELWIAPAWRTAAAVRMGRQVGDAEIATVVAEFSGWPSNVVYRDMNRLTQEAETLGGHDAIRRAGSETGLALLDKIDRHALVLALRKAGCPYNHPETPPE